MRALEVFGVGFRFKIMGKANLITERKRVFIYNIGCGLRGLDGARLENYFQLNGCIAIEDPRNADINILVTCAYKKSMEDECFKLIKKLLGYRGKVVVSGCLSEICPTRFKKEFDGAVLSPKNLDQIDNFFPSFKIKFKEVPDANVLLPVFGISKDKVGALPPVIRIAYGCLGQCTYCAIRFAVGKLRSKPITVCEKEYKALLEKGHKCFFINSEDVGSYGLDIGSSFPELLEKLNQADRRSDIHWKLFTFNPNNLIRYKDELLDYVRMGKIIDIQSDIQSGNQRILNLMNRQYEIVKVVEGFLKLRKANPNIYLRTICMVGFPSETEEEFLDTLSITKQLDLDYILIIPYSDRELTPSSKMPNKIPLGTVKKRMEMAEEYFIKENFRAYRDMHGLILMKSAPPYEG